ncbi:protein of ornithine decarboxylase antizyme family [Pseudohyphozyma bogoriensis]|nr:protein of ornithine decarboxylase antizyme family [Pseudohyphozyma bogoriensis]
MPGLASGAHKVVRGLSRSSASVTLSTSSAPSYPSHPLAPAPSIFGITPPSDNDSPLSTPSTSVSPPPPYATIYPPSPPASPSDLTSTVRLVEKHAVESVLANDDTLIASLFPAASPIHALPVTNVDLDDLVPSFKGAVVVDAERGTRTLYVGGGSYEDLDLRESVCGILERAEEELGCTGVVLALEKGDADLGGLLHSLMYVGGVISTGPFIANNSYLLVGLDL